MATANQEIRDLKNEVQQLAELVQENVNDNSHHFNVTRKDLRKAAKKAGKNVRVFLDEKSQKAAEMRDKAEEGIQQHPFYSVAGAIAGGILLGALLKRK